jgi:hypothetical protein
LERYVLAVLYFATSGPNWLWPYLSDEDVCNWNLDPAFAGVYCGTDSNNETFVNRVVLVSNNLRGTLPWELVLLTDLEYIDISDNRVTGPIPTRINELTKLGTLSAYINDLTGPLPTSFSNVTFSIDLTQNALTGSIPSDWAELMPNLQSLSVALNSLNGTIPTEFGTIIPLDSFRFYGNSITGSVDETFCGGFVWTLLAADCAEVDCPCCTKCCYDDQVTCVAM